MPVPVVHKSPWEMRGWKLLFKYLTSCEGNFVGECFGCNDCIILKNGSNIFSSLYQIKCLNHSLSQFREDVTCTCGVWIWKRGTWMQFKIDNFFASIEYILIITCIIISHYIKHDASAQFHFNTFYSQLFYFCLALLLSSVFQSSHRIYFSLILKRQVALNHTRLNMQPSFHSDFLFLNKWDLRHGPWI